MNKRVFSLLIAGVLTVGLLSGCGSNSEEKQTDNPMETEEAADEAEAEPETNVAVPEAGDSEESHMEVTDNRGQGGKTLVVYYSATGNTEHVANAIAEATGGELFELEPAEPYTSEDLDWTNDDSRVSREHENPEQREVELVSAAADDWSEVSVIYLGYPLWWGIAAWPVDSFVEMNDFTGKTVIPFCTSASSDLGESGELLAELAGTGEWQDGIRFRSGVSDEDVKAWVESLELSQKR